MPPNARAEVEWEEHQNIQTQSIKICNILFKTLPENVYSLPFPSIIKNYLQPRINNYPNLFYKLTVKHLIKEGLQRKVLIFSIIFKILASFFSLYILSYTCVRNPIYRGRGITRASPNPLKKLGMGVTYLESQHLGG
jgi:hypothetical protein